VKIKDDYILRSVANQHVVVPTGETAINFNGIITLNDTGKFLFEALKDDTDKEILIDKLTKNYDVTEEKARKDVEAFLDILRKNDLLDE